MPFIEDSTLFGIEGAPIWDGVDRAEAGEAECAGTVCACEEVVGLALAIHVSLASDVEDGT